MRQSGKKAVVVVILLVSAASVWAGGQDEEETSHPSGFPPLKITQLSETQLGSGSPVEDILTPIWREKTNVIPEVIGYPEGTAPPEWAQMNIVAGTLPHIIRHNGILQTEQAMLLLKDDRYTYSFTAEEIKQYLPRYTAYLAKHGISIDDVVADNLDPKTGKLWYIPADFKPQASQLARDMQAIVETRIGKNNHWMYLRDDILKMVYPDARSEKEMVQLYHEKGYLDYEDVIGDVPIRTQEDLFDYLMKVKALNLKTADGYDIIPGHPIRNKHLHAAMWSAYNLGGFWWTSWDGAMMPKGDTLQFAFDTVQWKELMRFYNKLWNNGLLDKEHFIQDNNQRNTKVTQGRYAVFEYRQAIKQAREYVKDNGLSYGFRKVPMLPIPLETEVVDHRWHPYNLSAAYFAVIVTKNVKEEDLPQVLNYIDWNFSEEAETLRHWGTPDMYTGEGENRRFTPKYKDLEDWIVYGKDAEKDGPYYGMYNREHRNRADYSRWSGETFGLRSPIVYVDNPYYVYPQELADDVDLEVEKAVRRHYMKEMVIYRSSGWTGNDFKAITEWTEQKRLGGWDNEQGKELGLKAVIGPEDQFDANWMKIEETRTAEYNAAFQKMADLWKEIYDQYEKPQRAAAAEAQGKDYKP